MIADQTSDHGCRRRSVLNLAGFLARSAANGPGIRAVLWVQGCPIRCRDCFNKASWSFSPINLVTAGHIADRILSTNDIDGVTFSGGEPFFQAEGLASVGEIVRDAGLTVVTYTGYTYDYLTSHPDSGQDRLLAVTDLLIAGPYAGKPASNDPSAGPSGKQIIDLSGRICREGFTQEEDDGIVEFSITPGGTITTTGFPKKQMIQRIAARCRGE